MTSFINYCDTMMIANEGVIKNKVNEFKNKRRMENAARIEKIRGAIPVMEKIVSEFKKALTKYNGKVTKENRHAFDPRDYDSDFFQIDVSFEIPDMTEKNELHRDIASICRKYSKAVEDGGIWIDVGAFKKNVFSICSTGESSLRKNKSISLVTESASVISYCNDMMIP